MHHPLHERGLPSPQRGRRLLAGSIAAAVVLSGSALAAAPAFAAGGTVTGTVFRDFNQDGVMNLTPTAALPAVDVGVAGVVVNAYDSTGAVVGTATSAADGTYSLTYTAAGTSTAVRLEFETPAGFSSGPHGEGNGITSGTSVQFVQAGDTANYGIAQQGDFSQADPYVAVPINRGVYQTTNGFAGPPGGAPVPNYGDQPAIYGYPYTSSGVPASNTDVLALQSDVGSVWGTAGYGDDSILSAATLRRGTAIGPGGLGAIYLTSKSQAQGGDPNASVLVTIPNAGADPRGGAQPGGGYDYFHDAAAFDKVSRVGLGDIEIDTSRENLYAVNLNDRQLYRVPLTEGPTGAPVAGAPVAIPTPLSLPGAAQGCASDAVVPYGLGMLGDDVYLTLTCTGPTQADLRAYVYSYDPATGSFSSAPVIETSLDYDRYLSPGSTQNHEFVPWTDTFAASPYPAQPPMPQPLASTITFDASGAAQLSILDRTPVQYGNGLGSTDPSDTVVYRSVSKGELLQICGSPETGWTPEANGQCGGNTGAITNSNFGPADGAGNQGIFYESRFRSGAGNVQHESVFLGSALQLPGFADVMATSFDPQPQATSGGVGWQNGVDQEGFRVLSNDNGSIARLGVLDGIRAKDSNTVEQDGSFGKAGGLGDLAALIDQAPIEIGNRVWIDRDRDGVQDPNDAEASVPGVTVHLYDATGALVATTTTNADGEYYFNNSNVPGGLLPNTNYTIAVDNPADFAAGGPLAGHHATVPNANAGATVADGNDSDGIPNADGILPKVTMTTGDHGVNDHTWDFGFVPPAVSVGDYVWVDSDRDGQQDAGEPGIPGVVLTLTGPDGQPVTDVFGNPVGQRTTDADGLYSFDDLPTLPPGQTYTVTIDRPASAAALEPYTPTVANTGNPATDSSTWTASSGDLTQDGDRDPTLDFGFVRHLYAVGDYVWIDDDKDGKQDDGEPAVPGVTVTLFNPDGTPATDWTGKPVPPVKTDANGHYVFDGLVSGDYYVEFTGTPEGYVFTSTGSGGGSDSNPNSLGRTPVFTLGQGGSDMRSVVASDGTTLASFIDPTIDAGLVRVVATPPATPTPEAPAPRLPRTGFDLPWAAAGLLSLLLMVIGVGMTVVRRRAE